MTEAKRSDRDRMRDFAKTIRNATRPREGENPRMVNICWDALFALLEVKETDAND